MTRYYSQFGEDAILAYLFKDQTEGVYLDIGAHNGVTDSNTMLLSLKGWSGICVEPHSVYYQALVKNRPHSICFNYVAWDVDGETVDFHETAPGGWSRVGGGGKHATVRVTHPETITLDSLLEDYEGFFDVVSIDVEGHEDHVMGGWKNWRNYDPRVLIVEDISYGGKLDEVFKEYYKVYAWKQGKQGSNIWYCREEKDYEYVKRAYR